MRNTTNNKLNNHSTLNQATTTTQNNQTLTGNMVFDCIWKGTKIAFISFSFLDYVVDTLVLCYVFLFVFNNEKTNTKKIFVVLIASFLVFFKFTFALPIIIQIIKKKIGFLPQETLINTVVYFVNSIFLLFYIAPVVTSLFLSNKHSPNAKKIKLKSHDIGENNNQNDTRAKNLQNNNTKDNIKNLKNVVIVMPIYNEELSSLLLAVESVIRSDYESSKMHLFLSFDDENTTPLYVSLLEELKYKSKNIYHSRIEMLIENVRVTICRFPHKGKSFVQGKSFELIYNIYGNNEVARNTFVMFIDSDIILHKNAIYNFVKTMENKQNLKALTGIVTCEIPKSNKLKFLSHIQDTEYIEGQLFMRSFEACLGTVTCLPGALSFLKLEALIKIEQKYFIDLDMRKTLNYHRYYLGEDRYMTHLLMEEFKKNSLDICLTSKCKTGCPNSIKRLIKQRRRWLLGAVVNEAYMLTTLKLWRKMPILMLTKTIYLALGSFASWLFIPYFIETIYAENLNSLSIVYIGLIVIKYITLCLLSSFKLNKQKVIVFFPIYFFLAPLFKSCFTFYSVLTWSKRSWGGPRCDSNVDIRTLNEKDMNFLRKTTNQRSLICNKKTFMQIRNTSQMMTQLTLINVSSKEQSQNRLSSKENEFVPIRKITPFPYVSEFFNSEELKICTELFANFREILELNKNKCVYSKYAIDLKSTNNMITKLLLDLIKNGLKGSNMEERMCSFEHRIRNYLLKCKQ